MATPQKHFSKVWEHFTKFPETDKSGKNVECKICKHRLLHTSSTANLWTHLQNKHGIVNEESLYFKSAKGGESRAQDAVNKMFNIPNRTKYPPSSSRYEDITHTLVKFIIQEFLPLQKVESNAFKLYSKALDPRYEVPGRKHLEGVMHCLYENAKKKTAELLTSLRFVSLTTDTWTSKANDGFIAVTAHGLTDEWKLQEYILVVENIEERHTASFLAQQLRSVAQRFSLETPVTISDSGANIKAAIRQAQWPRFPCAAHLINLAVKAGLEDKDPSDPVKQLLEKCRAVVGHFKHSSIATVKLRKAATLTENAGLATALVQEVPTRWNSCFNMLQRLLLLKPAVTSQLIEKESLCFSSHEWKLMSSIADVLRPIKTISETLCGSKYPTMSMVYPSIRNLIDFVLNEEQNPSLEPEVAQLKVKIRRKLEKDFQDGTNEDMMLMCTLVDPRFRYLVLNKVGHKEAIKKFKQFAEMVRDDVETEISFNFKPASSQGEENCLESSQKRKRSIQEVSDELPPAKISKWSEMFGPGYGKIAQVKPKKRDQLQIEIDNYLEEELLDENGDPLMWWKVNEMKFPILSLVAKKFLGVPATSVPCERVFSTAGEIVTKKRNRISVGLTEMYVFLKSYYKLD